MQSSISTSIHHTQPVPFNRYQSSSYITDIQDSNAAGRPFSFVPKRRTSSGSTAGKSFGEGSTACAPPQQGQIRLVEQPTSEDSASPQSTPRIFSTFPRTRPELPHARIPEFEVDVHSPTVLPDQPDILSEVDVVETPTPSYPVSAGPSTTFLIRKKSGELVKPSLKSAGFATWAVANPGRARTKSAPTTPIGSKSVHFDAQLEHVKLFLAEQKPLAVSRDGSPTETSEGDTTDTDFPFPRMTGMTMRLKPIHIPSPPPEPWTFDVRLEKIVFEDAALVGQVLVRNVAFAKWVAVRFTLDGWQTTSEVTARHVATLHDNTFDRFEFRVRLMDYLDGIESKRLVLCVRFSVEGREMWDSNGGENYEVGFEKVKEDLINQVHTQTSSGGSNGVPLMADLRKQLEKVAKDVQTVGSPPSISHRRRPRGLRVWLGDRVLGDYDGSSTLHPRSRSPSPLNDQNKPSSTPSLANTGVSLSARYDFGASLRSPNWTLPQAHSMTSTPSATTPRPRGTQHRVRSPSPTVSPSASGAVFQFPRAGQHQRNTTVPLDGSPIGPLRVAGPQVSSRDSADEADEGLEEDSGHQDEGACVEDKPRRHARSWIRRSSFETLSTDGPTVKKTPPGLPTVIPPTPPRQGAEFRLGSEDSSSSSSCSPSVSPSTSRAPFDNVWRTLYQDKDENFTSTPSITTSSSTPTTLSPLSPHKELPRAASEDGLTMGAGPGRSRVQRPPINSTPYHSFLDRFCFFTGVTPRYSQSYNITPDGISPRRTQSTSTVEDYFSLLPSYDDHPQPPRSSVNHSPSGSTTRKCSPIPADLTPSRGLTTSS